MKMAWLKIVSMLSVMSLAMAVGCAGEEGRTRMLGKWSRKEMVEMAGYGEEKLSTVLVTGTLLCEPCSSPISGALVGIACRSSGKSRSSWARAVTDEYGDFIVDLPSHLHAFPNLDKRCSVRVLRIPKTSPCRPGYMRNHKGLKLSSFGNGIRAYTAGNIKLSHSAGRSPQACVQNRAESKQMRW